MRVGLCGGKLLPEPSYEEVRESGLNIVVAGTEEGIVMVEAGAQEATEAEVVGAIEYGHACCQKIADAILKLQKLAGKPKRHFEPPKHDQAVSEKIEGALRAELTDAMDTQKYKKLESYSRVHDAKKKAIELAGEEHKDEAGKLFDALKERIFRDQMLKDRRRPDGRAFNEVRAIDIEVGVLPRTGSALLLAARRRRS